VSKLVSVRFEHADAPPPEPAPQLAMQGAAG
jgi:hypothetical protein